MLLERLRTSNSPPTDQEISHIRHKLLPTVSDDLSSIDFQLASIHEVVRAMEEERERLINIRKKYSNLLSLHRALPMEIWSNIFLYTISGSSDRKTLVASGSIWQLSHVCRRWRNIALSLRSFWSNIYISFPEAAQHEGEVQRLQTVMKRSRQGLLNITLGGEIAKMPSNFERIFDIVVAESYRCRELNIEPYTMWGWDSLFAQLYDRFPLLESLGVHYVQLDLKEQSVFKNCPCLTKLTLGGQIPPVVEFPWNQITALDLSDMDVDDERGRIACMRLIERCPSLETLSMPRCYLLDQEPYTPITCSNIRRLRASSVPVIDALTLPRLRLASLFPEPATTHGDIMYPFKQLLIRSNCLSALTGLSLFNVPLATSPEHSLLSILSQTHSLTSLSLTVFMQGLRDASNGAQIAAIVNSLEITPASKTVTFLPVLSSLEIRVSNHSDLMRVPYFGPVDRFASTLTARWKGDDSAGLAKLRTCHFTVQARYLTSNIYRDTEHVHTSAVFSEAERSIFTALVEDGMDLIIRVTSELTAAVGNNGIVFAVSR